MTGAVTRSAVSWLVPVIDAEWNTLSQILNEKKRFNEAEKLIHQTRSLAYDGSGAVSRDPENHSLATFPSGKQYNCDLSASYNIGARYFVRELLKPVPETERSALAAKVPGVQRRTSCVYADLILLNQVMEKPA